MTKNNKETDPLILQLVEQKMFDELYFILSDRNTSARDLIIFYKRFSKSNHKRSGVNIFQEVKYWQSELPKLHIESIMKSDVRVNWLSSYLSSKEFCNPDINKKLLEIDSSEFIRFFKYTKAFQFDSFFTSLVELKNDFSFLESHIKEIAIIKQNLSSIESESVKEDSLLFAFPLPYILSAFSLYYHAFKQQPDNLNNKAGQTQIEYALVEEVNRVIKLFFTHRRQNQSFNCFPSNKELQVHFDKYCEPHHILGKETPHLQSAELKYVYRLIYNMIKRKGLKGLIDMYCCGYSDFTNLVEEPYKLKTNASFVTFQFNNKKSSPEEFYLSNLSSETSVEELKNGRVDAVSEEKYFTYYGVPHQIDLNGEKLDLTKVCKLLKHLSVYKGPTERTFTNYTNFVVNNSAPNSFVKYFGTNESITLFEYQPFIESVSKYFSWSVEECESIVSYFATNLDFEQIPGEWVNNPFIICQGKVLWIGNLLKDRKWSTIILNKIKSEKRFAQTVTVVSKKVEENILDVFKTAGYSAFSLGEIKTLDGKKTDIDVIAYKGEHLILGEVKSGSRSDDYSQARFYEMMRLEGWAAEQLETTEQYVRENWEKIKTENNISDSITIDKLQIHPIIITDYFEGDLEVYKDKYLKTSLLELEVLLKNDKKKLLEFYLLHQLFTNSNNPDFEQKSFGEINWDLWGTETTLSTEMLLKRIETNAVWNGLEKIWKFQPLEYLLA